MPTLLDQQQVIQAVYDEALNRLRVDIGANITLGGDLEVFISHTDDSIRIGDGTSLVTTTTVGPKVGLDVNLIGGTISASVALDAFTKIPADNAIAVGTEDGTQTGIKHALVVGSDLNLRVLDQGANTLLSSLLTAALNIENSLPAILGPNLAANSLSVTIASDQPVIDVDVSLDAFTLLDPDNVQIVGSIDGSKTGAKYGFVNNVRQQILAAHDRQQAITYADFGTKDQRVTQIDYTSATFPGTIARKVLSYTLVGTKYRRDSINWVILP